jgi:hypothetical protein
MYSARSVPNLFRIRAVRHARSGHFLGEGAGYLYKARLDTPWVGLITRLPCRLRIGSPRL